MAIKTDDLTLHEKHFDQIVNIMKSEPYANFLGIKLTELGPGTASAELIPDENMLNTHNTIHGGIIFSLADYVFAAASNSYGRTAMGVTTNVNFMSAGKRGQTLRASAEEIKKNHKLGWYKIYVYSGEELCATMEAMVYRKSHSFVGNED
ncbi:PaaI family thioesterase [Neobacillus kokaensis]|uniref:Phenylacetic acid degradation protein n=1 Tax=Neobacillus kokaensis TaxID=2759023 RepID=A0ABQ3N0D8_9BACI|nr:PaaI family thioesterase [Neobacillus kokaensis]GHH97102.1 phenylacetic acid degradation protein [Neobacillus kokaensis]